MKLDLTLAGGIYDRTVPLMMGSVDAQGLNLRYLGMPIEEVFWRALRHHEFDATELSLGYFLTLRATGDASYVGIPVFPSRFFRHGCCFVAASSDLESLADLRGRTVGLPEYAMTACVWLRGMLTDEYGIQPHEIHWRVGGIEHPGRRDRADLDIPGGVDLRPIGPEETLNCLLEEERIDALFSPRIPSGFWSGRVRHLLRDYRSEELDYYRRTGIFPMMHLVAVRREVYERHPWVAKSLYDVYQSAKRWAYEWLGDINALPVSLPWYMPAYEETRALFGEDPWVDGWEANQRSLETLARYLTEQGLAAPDLSTAFAPNTLDEYVI